MALFNVYINLIFTQLMVTRSETLHDTFNWAIILQYYSILNYELFCKRNGFPLGAHFIYIPEVWFLIRSEDALKVAETCHLINK